MSRASAARRARDESSATRTPPPPGDGAPASDERCFGPAALRALLTQLPVGVLFYDRRGQLTYANDAARRLLERYSRPGADDETATSSPLRDRTQWALTCALLLGETVRDEELELTRPEGRRAWLSLSVTPLRDVAGEVEAAVLTITDVTGRKQSERWQPVIESLARL
jgi:PAS domain S-box-containing protein